MAIFLKRAYDPPTASDGKRILVDRLWPRGLAKVKAKFDVWLKDVAPSTELREWFDHDPAKWTEFQTRYRAELKGKGPGPTVTVMLEYDALPNGHTCGHNLISGSGLLAAAGLAHDVETRFGIPVPLGAFLDRKSVV